jgi:hypothetical protein
VSSARRVKLSLTTSAELDLDYLAAKGQAEMSVCGTSYAGTTARPSSGLVSLSASARSALATATYG